MENSATLAALTMVILTTGEQICPVLAQIAQRRHKQMCHWLMQSAPQGYKEMCHMLAFDMRLTENQNRERK